MNLLIPGKELRAFTVLLVVLLAGTEALLAHNTYYTEGEVMQGLYGLLVGANVPILMVALWKPRIGLWCAVALGALLLPWQAAENRKWALIHEEIFAVIRHVESKKAKAGDYPAAIDDYSFQRPWVREHVRYGLYEQDYRLDYFMDNKGISYWYKPNGGFGYYPD